MREPVFMVSDQVLRKPGYTALEDGLKFRIQKMRGFGYLCSENKSVDRLRGSRAANLRLCFHIMQKAHFLMTRLKITNEIF